MKIILRIIVLPFIIGILIIGYLRSLFKEIKRFLINGGELIVYPEDKKIIADVFEFVGNKFVEYEKK